MEAKREHVLSEYQAMQRAYWERMRGYRGNQDGGGGAPGYSYPGGYPGGYPGYGYGPYGIAPQ